MFAVPNLPLVKQNLEAQLKSRSVVGGRSNGAGAVTQTISASQKGRKRGRKQKASQMPSATGANNDELDDQSQFSSTSSSSSSTQMARRVKKNQKGETLLHLAVMNVNSFLILLIINRFKLTARIWVFFFKERHRGNTKNSRRGLE